jgi:dolichol-phosphate mannosyltransferase
MSPKKKLTVDLVIPVFNEAEIVRQIHERICKIVEALSQEFTFIYVNDGSSDGTPDELEELAKTDKRVRVLTLSRNFGHQAALTAGLDASQGEVVISMDADGQHPPEMIPRMLELLAQGYDIVQTQRMESARPVSFKKLTSGVFYRLINFVSGTRMVAGAADFRAMNRKAVEGLKSMPEYHRFLRGMITWMGFSAVILPYEEPMRMAGRSKYSLGKMVRLASDAVFSFSLMPLYIGLSVGALFMILALTQMVYVAVLWLSGQTDRIVPGWSSLMAVLLIASGIVMILLGFIGVYVGYIFQEVKRRPVYIIKDEQGGGN